MLHTSVKSKLIAANLVLNKIKACAPEALFELSIQYPSYEYRIYQLVWNEQPKPCFRLITLQVYDNHIHIKHYTNLLSKSELSSVFAAFPAKTRPSDSTASKALMDLVRGRLEASIYTVELLRKRLTKKIKRVKM
ncbi:hypothetical protein Aasi_0447 [Candidatus Amoebophilus asiaticus 5a2]|uniref:Uncharacterized protein n=1 Tax=Amoebophilus asiaticus (strain 5a2) TaxID=452471 RepID=B3ERK6_AMOA5|nr:hypothetical protein [Candidatus Amoebophilus asiaticus]ACE05858.1 hypothetical protein Aasi_0447 [Candidatus Amoebophilus asiaticus 5a2]